MSLEGGRDGGRREGGGRMKGGREGEMTIIHIIIGVFIIYSFNAFHSRPYAK